MATASDPFFRTFHALRIKGFAKADMIGEVAGLPDEVVEQHLLALKEREWAMFREARELWQLTPVGREQHRLALRADVEGATLGDLQQAYAGFLELNERFKELCGDWQLRDGQPNDHSDAAYDAAVVARLQAPRGRTRREI